MSQWTSDKAFEWYSNEDWPIGANFLPSSAINQLEMFQNETFDKQTITKELRMANSLGFNSMRVYLHDLLWNIKDEFLSNFEEFLEICDELNIKPIIVLFDDCHRSDPKLGKQFLPVRGIHNSGWSQSPGHKIVKAIHNGDKTDLPRLKRFTQEILDLYKKDKRILLWDIYNEPGQFGIGEESFNFLKLVWDWAHEVRPQQPLTSCMHGSIGENIIALNKEKSDIITFHAYESTKLQKIIDELLELKRPIICTEYMAREFGTTFDFCLPIFKKNNIGCFNWGFVAGKSQTHFGWDTILKLKEGVKNKDFILDTENIPEPEIWFHDIFRKDGSAFDEIEVGFIKNFLK
jgi:hypothetical protein